MIEFIIPNKKERQSSLRYSLCCLVFGVVWGLRKISTNATAKVDGINLANLLAVYGTNIPKIKEPSIQKIISTSLNILLYRQRINENE